MVDYREILRLASIPENGQRRIAAIVHSSRDTVRSVLAAAKEAGVQWPLDDDVTNAMLRNILFPTRSVAMPLHVEPDFQYIHRELAKPGVNLTLLWTEYCNRCEQDRTTPYMYTQFCERYRHWARLTKATMRIQHKPGDVMQVDWAGNTLEIHDPVTGDVDKGYLFVAVLPCSCYAYVEVCADMRQETWLLCHVHAYNYFGGVTRLLVPDNLKTGVKSNTRYETILNRSYQEMAEHYDTAIVPTRVRHPKDKALAEGTVKFASTWILAALRDRKFFSVHEAQKAAAEKLEELNDRPFKKREGSLAMWTGELLVGNDYLVSDGVNKYSVPFDLIGEKVVLRLTLNTVEVFYRGDRVAMHMRNRNAQREPIVKPEHMPKEHRKYLAYNADDFSEWGSSVGKNTSAVVQYFLTSGKEPEQGFKACASVRKLEERYGAKRLENACARLLAFSSSPSVRVLNTILKNGQDKLPQPEKPQSKKEPATRTQHGFTRGAEYFRKGGASR